MAAVAGKSFEAIELLIIDKVEKTLSTTRATELVLDKFGSADSGEFE